MKKRKWIINTAKINIEKLDISKVATKVLLSRGYDSKFKIEEFVNSKYQELFDPFLLKDMQKACDIIKESIKNNEKIVIYGDYDVDGVTSTSIVTDYLENIGANVEFYIPNRANEGYGLNKTAIDILIEKKVDLIITVDTGITAVEEVDYLNEKGIKVIITDHHSCKEKTPNALAVINPKQEDCKYPFKELAGVGVAFKLLCALDGDYEKITKKYSDIVAIGTIADVMPIISENRAIIAKGVEKLNKTENIGLYKLMQELSMKEVTSTSISFRIAPRLNAAGRMGLATDAVRLILTKDEKYAEKCASDLCKQNAHRQDEEFAILTEVLEKIEREVDIVADKAIVIWGENWHHGVVGIVSSRIIERYNLPVIVLSVEDGVAKGSARSIKGFNVFETLVELDEYLIKYGGHELAAGLTINEENLEEFREKLLKIAEERITDDMLLPELKIDCELEFSEININEVNGLSALEPYGMANAQPVFCSYDAVIASVTPLTEGKHQKIILKKDGKIQTAMLFSVSTEEFIYKPGDVVSVAYSLSINEFKGNRSVQMILRDITIGTKQKKLEDLSVREYKNFCTEKEFDKKLLKPEREDLVKVWKEISDNNFSIRDVARKHSISPGKVLICLDIFKECNLLDYTKGYDLCNIKVNKNAKKADTNQTEIIKKLSE